ncbi:hypothetical protein SDD27957_07500 [Streptococcus dysgalactiae subsp. dysgalactiae ATCC 27957]|nr:hypothetical protein SDD27957_07500 [Streptococcus dysgalactiae subsp. dysgalactiae ATCC 27957]
MDNTTQESDYLDEAPVLYWFKTLPSSYLKNKTAGLLTS